MDTDTLSAPESIRAYLDAGGDPFNLERWWNLVDSVVLERRMFGTERVREHSEHYLEAIDHYGVDNVPRGWVGDDVWERDDMVKLGRESRWTLEVLGDDELLSRFEAALPPDYVADALRKVDLYRRPLAATVEPQDESWVCALTGKDVIGPAVVLSAREDDVVELPIKMSPAALVELLES